MSRNSIKHIISAEELAEALGGAKRHSQGWLCFCPAHKNDGTPALSVMDAEEGKLRFKCHGPGCTTKEINDALKERGLWSDSIAFGWQGKKSEGPSQWDGFDFSAPVVKNAGTAPRAHARHGPYDHIYSYRNIQGQEQFRRARWDKNDARGKEFSWLSVWANAAGVHKWRWSGPPATFLISPFGVEKVGEHPGRPILIVEGEKTAIAGQNLLPEWNVLGVPGSQFGKRMDWEFSRSKRVVVWPDCDVSSRKFAIDIEDACLEHGAASVDLLRPPPGVVKGWDLADAEAQGWNTGRVLDWINHAKAPVDTGSLGNSDALQLLPLGYDHQSFYYLSSDAKQVQELTASQHKDLNLLGLVSNENWWSRQFKGKGGPDWKCAASDMMARAKKRGVFQPDRIRGRGAWMDKGNVVLHLGSRCVVNGEAVSLIDASGLGSYIYEAGPELQGPEFPALNDKEASLMLEAANSFSWITPMAGELLAGWLVLAPLGGVWNWRPHAWVTAAAGSGKSTLQGMLVKPMLHGLSLEAPGATTEAGIRQQLKRDALPVLIDESESEDQAGILRIQQVLQLARQSSSDETSRIIKGTAGGKSTVFHSRSMFMFSSIGVAAARKADISRLAILELGPPKGAEHYQALLKKLYALQVKNYPARMIARTIQNVNSIRGNAETIAKAIERKIGNRRAGDQYGHLLAGALSCKISTLITDEQADDIVAHRKWLEIKQNAEETDEKQILSTMIQTTVSVDAGGTHLKRSLGELLAAALRIKECGVMDIDCEATLKRYGFKILHKERELVIANKNVELQKVMFSTPYRDNWNRYLARVPGAKKTGAAIRFTTADVQHGVIIPLANIFEGIIK